MAPTIHELGLDKLSFEDRLAIADALWDSVAEEAESRPLSKEEEAELDRRLADSIARPEAVTPWEVVRERVLARFEYVEVDPEFEAELRRRSDAMHRGESKGIPVKQFLAELEAEYP